MSQSLTLFEQQEIDGLDKHIALLKQQLSELKESQQSPFSLPPPSSHSPAASAAVSDRPIVPHRKPPGQPIFSTTNHPQNHLPAFKPLSGLPHHSASSPIIPGPPHSKHHATHRPERTGPEEPAPAAPAPAASAAAESAAAASEARPPPPPHHRPHAAPVDTEPYRLPHLPHKPAAAYQEQTYQYDTNQRERASSLITDPSQPPQDRAEEHFDEKDFKYSLKGLFVRYKPFDRSDWNGLRREILNGFQKTRFLDRIFNIADDNMDTADLNDGITGNLEKLKIQFDKLSKLEKKKTELERPSTGRFRDLTHYFGKKVKGATPKFMKKTPQSLEQDIKKIEHQIKSNENFQEIFHRLEINIEDVFRKRF